MLHFNSSFVRKGEADQGGGAYRELQGFIEQAVLLAVQEGIGASLLGYSYLGQASFLQRDQRVSECTT